MESACCHRQGCAGQGLSEHFDLLSCGMKVFVVARVPTVILFGSNHYPRSIAAQIKGVRDALQRRPETVISIITKVAALQAGARQARVPAPGAVVHCYCTLAARCSWSLVAHSRSMLAAHCC